MKLKNFLTTPLLIIFFVGCISLSGFLGYNAGKSKCEFCPEQEIDLSLFWQTYHKLQEKFVDRDKLDVQKMIYGAIEGMVDSLGDPYTVFLKPDESKRFKEDISGKFEGVGIEIGMRDKQLQVIAPLEGTPAQKAGIRTGDKIIKVNDVVIANMSLNEIVNLIRGPRGTEVKLTISRDDCMETQDIKIIRGVIKIPSLKWELKDNNIAYIKLYQFSMPAGSDFKKIALEILDSSAEKIILDLRNNPGGYLEISQNIAGWFLKTGDIVVSEDFSDEVKKKEYRANGPGKLLPYPMVILVNQGSASASEILAAAIRDNRGVKLIGEKTYGKGSVQQLEGLKDGASLKVTVAKWLTPKNELINGIGLEPDIKVEISEEDYEQDKDPQLDKAIEIIQEIK